MRPAVVPNQTQLLGLDACFQWLTFAVDAGGALTGATTRHVRTTVVP